jgi:hypothetical protein
VHTQTNKKCHKLPTQIATRGDTRTTAAVEWKKVLSDLLSFTFALYVATVTMENQYVSLFLSLIDAKNLHFEGKRTWKEEEADKNVEKESCLAKIYKFHLHKMHNFYKWICIYKKRSFSFQTSFKSGFEIVGFFYNKFSAVFFLTSFVPFYSSSFWIYVCLFFFPFWFSYCLYVLFL